MSIDHTLDLKGEGVAISLGTTSLGQQPNYDPSANVHGFLVPTKGYIIAPWCFLPLINRKLICNSATMIKHWKITHFRSLRANPFDRSQLCNVTTIRILRKRTTKLAERKRQIKAAPILANRGKNLWQDKKKTSRGKLLKKMSLRLAVNVRRWCGHPQSKPSAICRYLTCAKSAPRLSFNPQTASERSYNSDILSKVCRCQGRACLVKVFWVYFPGWCAIMMLGICWRSPANFTVGLAHSASLHVIKTALIDEPALNGRQTDSRDLPALDPEISTGLSWICHISVFQTA